jgi:hypothetical protein
MTALCWRYGNGQPRSPQLTVRIDVNMSGATSFVTYNLDRWQSTGNKCPDVPASAHYNIAFRPGSNDRYIYIVKR